MHSQNVLLQDIYVNGTSTNRVCTVLQPELYHVSMLTRANQPARNTDGGDVLFSDHVTFNRWTVDNGDDASVNSQGNQIKQAD